MCLEVDFRGNSSLKHFFFLLQDKILAAVVKWMDGTTFVYLFLTQNKALPVFVTIKSIPDDHDYKAEP